MIPVKIGLSDYCAAEVIQTALFPKQERRSVNTRTFHILPVVLFVALLIPGCTTGIIEPEKERIPFDTGPESVVLPENGCFDNDSLEKNEDETATILPESISDEEIVSGKPVITLLGDNPEIIIVGSVPEYSDPGAVAYDATDGDITDKIITSIAGRIFTGSPGIYYIEFTVENSMSHVCTAVRTVRVKCGNSGECSDGYLCKTIQR